MRYPPSNNTTDYRCEPISGAKNVRTRAATTAIVINIVINSIIILHISIVINSIITVNNHTFVKRASTLPRRQNTNTRSTLCRTASVLFLPPAAAAAGCRRGACGSCSKFGGI